MSKAYTTEEKRQFVTQAVEDYRKAQELVDHACVLMRRCGVQMCGGATTVFGTAYEEDAKVELHVFSGIKNLARILDQQMRHPLDIWKEKRQNNIGAVVADGVMFYQLGDARDVRTKLHFR